LFISFYSTPTLIEVQVSRCLLDSDIVELCSFSSNGTAS